MCADTVVFVPKQLTALMYIAKRTLCVLLLFLLTVYGTGGLVDIGSGASFAPPPQTSVHPDLFETSIGFRVLIACSHFTMAATTEAAGVATGDHSDVDEEAHSTTLVSSGTRGLDSALQKQMPNLNELH